ARLRALREEGRALIEAYDELGRYVRVHVRALLTLKGYRTHKGQWRRRRRALPATEPPNPEPMPKKSKPAPFPAGPVAMHVAFGRNNAFHSSLGAEAEPADLEAARA